MRHPHSRVDRGCGGQVSVRQPVYVLVDTSGSTARGGFAAACAQLLPMLIDAAAQRAGLLISVLCYGTQARLLVGLNAPGDISMIPVLVPGGLSSLAAGLRLLAESVRQDARQLVADGIDCLPPAVLVLADGLPTDDDASLLAAANALADVAPGMAAPVCAMPLPVVTEGAALLAIRGLGMDYLPLASGTPDAVASCALDVFACLLDAATGTWSLSGGGS
jgi:uncharacterized protein YegL